jgi:hypothetical protein
MPREKEYHVLFELCFCNLRFKFRFLDAPLGIESELIIVFNFLHLAPKTSANKPAMVISWPVEMISKESPEQCNTLLVGIHPLRRAEWRVRLAQIGSYWLHLISSSLLHTFQVWIKSHQEKLYSNDYRRWFLFSFLLSSPFLSSFYSKIS